jgi:hypothetical protein
MHGPTLTTRTLVCIAPLLGGGRARLGASDVFPAAP